MTIISADLAGAVFSAVPSDPLLDQPWGRGPYLRISPSFVTSAPVSRGPTSVGVIAVDGTKVPAKTSHNANMDHEQIARAILDEAKAEDALLAIRDLAQTGVQRLRLLGVTLAPTADTHFKAHCRLIRTVVGRAGALAGEASVPPSTIGEAARSVSHNDSILRSDVHGKPKPSGRGTLRR